MTGSIFNVAIVGGGIGGLTFALALSRGRRDIAIDIYEAGPNFSEFGAGLGLWPRVLEMLHSFGLAEDLIRYAGSPNHEKNMQFRKADERDGIIWGETAVGLYGIHRADLLEILVNHTAARCTSHFSKKLVAYEDTQDGPVILQFADGVSASCDLLVGADGVNSAVRANMYNQMADTMEKDGRTMEDVQRIRRHTGPAWTGAILYRYLIPREILERAYPDHVCLDTPTFFQGKSKNIIAYPISRGRWINTAAIIAKHQLHGGTYDGPWSVRVSQDEVMEHFTGWDPIAQALVQPTRWVANTVINLPTFVSGRVAVLGDAAHAMTTYQAAGAGQAVEDGFILAALLSQPETDKSTIPLILHVYDEVRRPIAQDLQRYSLYTGQMLLLERMEGVTAESSAAGHIPKEKLLKQNDELQDLYGWAWTTSAIPDRDRALEIYKSRLRGLGSQSHIDSGTGPTLRMSRM